MNVLSIDFDIIMAPDIGLYNEMVGTSPDGSRSIEKRIQEYPMLSGCRADLKHYQRLLVYILNIVKTLNIDDIYVAFSHENIKNMLTGLNDVNIYSIDHHHDLGYPQMEEQPEDICSCANWGDFFLKKGVINHFQWINNNNSGDLPPEWQNSDKITVYDLQDLDLNKLPTMDKLFLCLSPEWVPSMYHPLFYTALDLMNREKQCVFQMH